MVIPSFVRGPAIACGQTVRGYAGGPGRVTASSLPGPFVPLSSNTAPDGIGVTSIVTPPGAVTDADPGAA